MFKCINQHDDINEEIKMNKINIRKNKYGFNLVEFPPKQRAALKLATFFEENGVYAYLCFTGYDEYRVTEVYFVSGTNGDEFGQFPTMIEALEKAVKMASLYQEDRRKFDE